METRGHWAQKLVTEFQSKMEKWYEESSLKPPWHLGVDSAFRKKAGRFKALGGSSCSTFCSLPWVAGGDGAVEDLFTLLHLAVRCQCGAPSEQRQLQFRTLICQWLLS